MQRQTRPYEQRLDQTLILRSVRDERDIDRFAAFNTAINGADQGMTCAQLLRYHPEIAPDDFLYVEDQTTGEVVSTTCLIPWRCQYGPVALAVAMLEMVVTHPAYRQRGLVRKQIERFHQAVCEQKFDLSIIEGIPYYYRQFGYAYAGDHYGFDALPAWRIPTQTAAPLPRLHVRPATVADIPQLMRLYGDQLASLPIHTVRSEPYWHFLLEQACYPTSLVEDEASQRVLGYFCRLVSASERVRLVESAIADAATGLALLQGWKAAGASEIQLGWPETGGLVQLARSLGSTPVPGDQWLVRMVDVAALLQKLAPVFAERLAESPWAGLSAELVINLFRQAYVLAFVAGRLVTVKAVGFVDASMGADGGDLSIPPNAFVRLLLGYRTLDELRDAWPDIVVKPGSRPILEQLFPRQASSFHMPYLYRGPLDAESFTVSVGA